MSTDATDPPITLGPSVSRHPSRLTGALHLVRSTETHPPHHAHFDVPESHPTSALTPKHDVPVIDIEHVPVEDDPREWSKVKKQVVLWMMIASVLGPLIAPSIYNPVIDDVKADLHATDTQIGLSLSMYILFQGWMPLIWASVAEIIGRKIVYLSSYAIYTVACVIASRSSNMLTLIGMRCLQATGSAAVVAVGAGSLADMFEVHERGQKLGLFYGMPLLGPAMAPLLGGALGNAFGWRSAFYFLAAFAGIVEIMFIFFPDTWRRERSRVYQKAVQDAIKRAMHHDEKRQRKLAKGLASNAPTPPETPGRRLSTEHVVVDTEKNEVVVKRRWLGLRKDKVESAEHEPVRPSFRDVNPLPTMWSIFKRPTNLIILLSSGLLFSAQYTTTYTASVTLARAPYNYNALNIGLVILSFGVGSIIGSIGGGRWSDRVLRKLKRANGGVSVPEMRLKSTIIGMPLVVASFLAYAWTAGKTVNIAGIVVSLFFCGLSLMLIYSSTLAYLVDANPGRSASAVACNSFIRGSCGCVLSQAAIPIQNAIGDGGLYSLIAGLLALSCCGISLLAYKGEAWRSSGHVWPWERKRKSVPRGDEGSRVETAVAASSTATSGKRSSLGKSETGTLSSQ